MQHMLRPQPRPQGGLVRSLKQLGTPGRHGSDVSDFMVFLAVGWEDPGEGSDLGTPGVATNQTVDGFYTLLL